MAHFIIIAMLGGGEDIVTFLHILAVNNICAVTRMEAALGKNDVDIFSKPGTFDLELVEVIAKSIFMVKNTIVDTN